MVLKKLKVLFFGQFTINHDYAGQGLAFPIMDYFNKYFDVEYSFMISKRYVKENLGYVKEKGFKIVPFPYPKFFLNNQKLIKAIKDTDVIIDVDGDIFNGKRGFKKRWFHYYRVTYIHYLARKYNKIYLKSPKSYGPFNTKFFRFCVRKTLNDLPFIFVRGKNNFYQLKKLNLKTKLYDCPDVSLLLKPESSSWARKYLKKIGIDISKEIIGLTPNTIMPGKEKHIELCKKIIEYFQSKNKQILLIPHSLDGGENIVSCDLALDKQIYNGLKNKGKVFLLADMNLEYKHIRSITGLLSFYISGRYHGLISSLVMGVPSIALSWHIKYKDMMSLFLSRFLALDNKTESNYSSMEKIKQFYNNQDWFDKKKVGERKKKLNKIVEKNLERMIREVKCQL